MSTPVIVACVIAALIVLGPVLIVRCMMHLTPERDRQDQLALDAIHYTQTGEAAR